MKYTDYEQILRSNFAVYLSQYSPKLRRKLKQLGIVKIEPQKYGRFTFGHMPTSSWFVIAINGYTLAVLK